MDEKTINLFEQKVTKLSNQVAAIDNIDIQEQMSCNKIENQMLLMRLNIMCTSINYLEATLRSKSESAMIVGQTHLVDECYKKLSEVKRLHDEIITYIKSLR